MLCLTLLPLTRRTNNNWLFKNKTPLQESKGMGVRLEHLSVQQRPKQMVLEGLEKQVHIDHTLSLPQASTVHVERCPLRLQLLQWEKRIQKGQSAFLRLLCGSLYSDLTRGCRESVGLNTGNLTMTEKGEASNNQCMDLGKPNSYLQCPSSNCSQQFCSSAELSQWCSLTREVGRVQICLIQILKQGVMPALEPGLPPARQGAES